MDDPSAKAPASRGPLAAVEDALNWVACIALAVMTALIAADALGRALFHLQIQSQFELTELYLMPAIAVLSLSRAFRRRAHITLDLVGDRALGAAAQPVRLLVLLLSAAFAALVAWKSGAFALEAFRRDDVFLGVYDWPLWLAYASVPLGFGLLTLRIITDAVALIRAGRPLNDDRTEDAYGID
ncbi:MAG: TRAP transporter small permease [Alphaproteobacteria bacterium]